MASKINYTADDVYNTIFHDNWDEVERMVEHQPLLLNEKYDGVTTLYRIALYAESEDFILKMLKFAKRDEVDALNKRPSGHDTIFHRLAIRGFSKAVLSALAVSTTQVNWQTTSGGNTPLHWLLRFSHTFVNHRDAVQAFLDAGADVNIKNTKGRTPVDEYIQNGCSGYDDTSKEQQKEEILQLLQRKTIPIEILARGSEALRAYNEALKEGETEVNQGRTFFVGLERVGKTSTINSFLRKGFNPNEDITDAIATKTACTQNWHGELNWKETSNHPGVADIYNDALAASMTNQLLGNEKKKEETAIAKEEQEMSMETSDIEDKLGQQLNEVYVVQEPVIMDAASPQSTEGVPENIASKVEERMKAVKFTREATSGWRRSCSNDFIMNIWDFGGQPIYHVIQRIFMVSFAVVCVVFNLNDDLDAPAYVMDPTTGDMYRHRMTNLQFILYWIRSAFMNTRDLKFADQLSPSVLLIGTHLNSLDGNAEEKAEEKFSTIRKAMEGKPYEAMVFPEFFAIENSLEFSINNACNKIMKQITKLAMKMVKTLPLKWLLVQQEIQQLRQTHIYLPTTEVFALVSRCGVVKSEAQRVILEYLHDLGEILYFPDDDALKNIIVLDLMQLVDMFKTIITVIQPNLQEPHLRDAWMKLNSGILEERLLRHLWMRFELSDETFDFFVSLMQRFGLVCKKRSTKGGQRVFYVLARLKPERIDLSSNEDYEQRAVSVFHDFGGYLPDDLFQRGVTKFIEEFQVDDAEPKLSYEHVQLDVDELHFVVLDVVNIKQHRRMLQTTIVRRRILNSDDDECEPLPTICKKVVCFLEIELKLFGQSGARGVELNMYIPCVCSTDISDAHMHMMRNFDRGVLPCGSNGMEMTRYRRLFGDESQEAISLSQSEIPKPEGYVDDIVIAMVSEEMDLSWRRFGVQLDLKWSIVNKFYADERQTEKAVKTMIEYWRSKFKSGHQLKVLCAALRQHRLNILADTLCQDDADETLSTPQSTATKEYFDDKDLMRVCNDLGSEWKTLGLRLGLEWTDIKQISNNNRQAKDCAMETLVSWRDSQSANQVPVMVRALRDHGLVRLADSVCDRQCYNYTVETDTPPHTVLSIESNVGIHGCLTDIDLLFIAERFYDDWKNFGTYLGLKRSRINQIQSDFSPPLVDACVEMLFKWREGLEANADHLSKMCDALTKFEREDIKDELQTYYQTNN